MQKNKALQTLILLLIIIASLYLIGLVWGFLSQFTNVILLFFLAWLLAFVLRPIARWLTTQGMPYTLSVTMVYILMGTVAAIAGYLLVPLISQQVQQLAGNYNAYLNSLYS